MAEVSPVAESVTLVTQTRVLPDKEAAFLAWQQQGEEEKVGDEAFHDLNI